MAKPIPGLVRVGKGQTLSLREVPLELVEIQAGEFVRGNEKYGLPHFVRLTKPFAIGRDAVNWGQWRAVGLWAGLSTAILGDGRPDHWPVAGIDWAQAYEWTQAAAALTGTAIRLPTDAEWSLAAQGAPVNIGQLARDERYIIHSESEFCAWLQGRIDIVTHPSSGRFFLSDQMEAAWQLHQSGCALIGMRRCATQDGRCPSSIGFFNVAGDYVPAKPDVVSSFGVCNMLGEPYEWLFDVGGRYGIAPTDGMIWEDPLAGGSAPSSDPDTFWEPHVYRGGTHRLHKLRAAARRQWRALGSDHDWRSFGLRVVIGDVPPVGGRWINRREGTAAPQHSIVKEARRGPVTPIQIKLLQALATRGPLTMAELQAHVSTPSRRSQMRNVRPAVLDLLARQWAAWVNGGRHDATRLRLLPGGTKLLTRYPPTPED